MQAVVAQTVDRFELHATAPALLLDLQGKLGDLSREALRITENGRRPFRPTSGWEGALAEVAFAVLSLADQTGVDLEQAVQGAVARLSHPPGRPAGQGGQDGQGGQGGQDGYPPPDGRGGSGPDAAGHRGTEPGRGFGHRGPGPDPRDAAPGRRNAPPDDWPLSY